MCSRIRCRPSRARRAGAFQQEPTDAASAPYSNAIASSSAAGRRQKPIARRAARIEAELLASARGDDAHRVSGAVEGQLATVSP